MGGKQSFLLLILTWVWSTGSWGKGTRGAAPKGAGVGAGAGMLPGACWWRGLGRCGHNSSGFSNPPPACLQKQLMAVEGDEMGLAADSKGSTSCPAGQCARCPPASRLGAPAPAGRGARCGLPGVGASCPGCPRCPWGLLVDHGVLVGCSRVGAQPAWHSRVGPGDEGTPSCPCQELWPSCPRNQECFVPPLEPPSQDGEANLVV